MHMCLILKLEAISAEFPSQLCRGVSLSLNFPSQSNLICPADPTVSCSGQTLSRSFGLVCLAHLTVLPISLSPRPTRAHDEAGPDSAILAARCVGPTNCGSIKLSAPFHSPAHKKHTKVSQRKHSSRWTYFPKQEKFALVKLSLQPGNTLNKVGISF